jgi:hypothetical protein
MPKKKKIAESKYYDATVIKVILRRWVQLEADGLDDAFKVMHCPDEYREPKVDDRIKLEMRPNPRRPHARQQWDASIVGWPQERSEIHDLVGYDS